MFKDKELRIALWGRTAKLNIDENAGRIVDLSIPGYGEEKFRHYEFRLDDGFILELIRRIEKLENRVEQLETKKKK